MREKGRWAERGTERGVGVHIRKRTESLMIQGTREEDEVMGVIGTEGIRTDMMMEIGEVEGVTITDGDENMRSTTGVGDNLWSVVFTFGSSQFRRSYIKLEPLSKLFNVFYSYIAKVKWSLPILCAKDCTTQSLWPVQIASVSRSSNSKGNRTPHCLHPANHTTCSLVPSF